MYFVTKTTWLNKDTFSFLLLLTVFSIVIHFIDNENFWGRLRSFKLGASGIELDLDEAHKKLIQEEIEAQPDEMKDELEELRERSRNSLENFVMIENKINEKLMSLAEINDMTHVSFGRTIRALEKLDKIDRTTFSLLTDFRPIRNKIIHDYFQISRKQMESSIELGELIISRLTMIYVQDVPEERSDEYIENSEANNPKLRYHKGKSKSGKIGHVGMYYSLREDS